MTFLEHLPCAQNCDECQGDHSEKTHSTSILISCIAKKLHTYSVCSTQSIFLYLSSTESVYFISDWRNDLRKLYSENRNMILYCGFDIFFSGITAIFKSILFLCELSGFIQLYQTLISKYCCMFDISLYFLLTSIGLSLKWTLNFFN